MEAVALFMTSWTGIGVLCGGILLSVVVVYLRLLYKALPIERSVRGLNGRLAAIPDHDAFAQSYEDFHEIVSSSRVVGHIWREYSDTLVFPRSEDSRRIIRNTNDAASFFNFGSIVESRINVRFYREVSNYLPGLGILFTFVGLTAGIYLARGGLMTNDPEIMRSALSQLLNGASLAFLTSITGLLLSLPYSYAEKKLDHRIQMAIDEWCNGLDSRLQSITPEQIASDQLGELKDQTRQLERFNTDLAVSISTALDERLEQRFIPVLQQTLEVLEGIRREQRESSETSIQRMVEEFRKLFTSAAGTEMTAMADTLRQLTSQLETVASSISGAGAQVGRNLEESTTAIADQMQTMAENMRSAGEDAGASLSSAAGHMVEQFTEASGNIREASLQMTEGVRRSVEGFQNAIAGQSEAASEVRSVVEAVSGALNQLKGNIQELRGVHAALERVSTPLAEVAYRLTGIMDEQKGLVARMQELQTSTIDAAASVDGAGNSLRETWENVHGRFEQIDRDLSKAFEEIHKGVTAYTDGTRKFVTELDQNLSRTVSILSGAIEELSSSVEQLGENLPGGGS